MEFISLDWIAWMWATVALYWLAPRSVRLYALAAISFLFLSLYSMTSVVFLCIFTFLCHVAANKKKPSTAALSAVGILMVAILIWFKLGLRLDPQSLVETALIPLGLSYYTFRCIHFLMERFTGRLPALSFKELVAYLFFLPTLVVGPIHRADDFVKDLRRHRFDGRLLSEGGERILYGYVKVAVLSNFLVERHFGGWILEQPEQESAFVAYMLVVKNGLNIYLQFSGYSDIAIGFARLLGFRVIENFNWPYLQTNISNFWRSWHISLSFWCREYVYNPVLSWTRNPALGALATMFIIGMWHEISMRYLCWGLYHGLGIVVWQYWQKVKTRVMPEAISGNTWITDALSIITTVHFVWFSFVIVTEESLWSALAVYRSILLWWL